jgi:hypothetical protein
MRKIFVLASFPIQSHFPQKFLYSNPTLGVCFMGKPTQGKAPQWQSWYMNSNLQTQVFGHQVLSSLEHQ